MNEVHLLIGLLALAFLGPIIAACMGIKDERPKSKKGQMPVPIGERVYDPYYNGR